MPARSVDSVERWRLYDFAIYITLRACKSLLPGLGADGQETMFHCE